MLETDTPWTWERRTWDFEGTTYTEWKGDHPYHTGVVSNFPDASRWQARIGDQHSPYYRAPASARAWCERYGRPRKRAR